MKTDLGQVGCYDIHTGSGENPLMGCSGQYAAPWIGCDVISVNFNS
jgi:hypothetical protein